MHGAPRLALALLMMLAVTGFSLGVVCQGTSADGGAVKHARSAVKGLFAEIDLAELAGRVEEGRRIGRINRFLEGMGSPLAGLADRFIDAGERTGVSPELLVAVTMAESTCGTNGSLSRTNYNAWGMKGPQPQLGIPAEGGYCWWPDWPAAIDGAAVFVAHYWGPAQTGLDLRGYARRSGPGSSWLAAVESARKAML